MFVHELFENDIDEDLKSKIRTAALATMLGSAAATIPTSLNYNEPNFKTDLQRGYSIPDKPPDYKKEIVDQVSWEEFKDALKNANISERMRYIYSQIFAAEGGLTHKPGKIVAGIVPKLLDLAKSKGVVPPTINHAAELTAPQIVDVYNLYFESILKNVGGISAIENIRDPAIALQVSDILFRYGSKSGARIVQRSIYDVLLKIPDKNVLGLGSIAPKSITAGGLDSTKLSVLNTLGMNYFNMLQNEMARYSIIRAKHKPGDANRSRHLAQND